MDPRPEREIDDGQDARLVARHLAGDETAFATLFRRHHPALLSFCRRRVRDAHLAEEIAQEAFSRACQALDKLADPHRFYPWLTVIARHAIIDHQRRNGRVTTVQHLDPGSSPAAEDIWLEQSDAGIVLIALDRVGPRHREVLHLDAWEDLSYEAIAERIGRPVSTVTPLLHRARAALRREYLALIESDQLGARILLPPVSLTAAARRLRDRIMKGLSNLPDLNGLSVPAMSLVIGMTGVLAPSAPTSHDSSPRALSTWRAVPASEASDKAGAATVRVDPDSAARPARPRNSPAASETPPPDHVVPGVAEANVDNPSRSDWTRERARRMPIYIEVGPWWFGANPEWRPDGSDGLLPP